MSELLGVQIGLDDLIFAHRKGKKETHLRLINAKCSRLLVTFPMKKLILFL